jgi:hypothetical protein
VSASRVRASGMVLLGAGAVLLRVVARSRRGGRARLSRLPRVVRVVVRLRLARPSV